MATFKIKREDGTWEVIGGSNITTDSSLTQRGQAADAKIVGDIINTLATKEDIEWGIWDNN